MRNLRNTRHAAVKWCNETAPLAATAWDSTGLVCSFGPSGNEHTITLKRLPEGACNPDQLIGIASWEAPPPNPDLTSDQILDLCCFPDTGTISLVLEGGDIVVVREDPGPGEDLIEIVGSVDAGILTTAWSPDEDLLVIATKAGTLLFMTRDFESTASVHLGIEDLKVSNHVSVGWGKSETQFKGRGAKALRDPTVPEHVDEGKLSAFDDGRISISWRGDGQFVAVNSVLESHPRRRVIRVYSRDGTLDSVSEPIDGLEGALSWKPSGQLIAGIQRRPENVDVVFFERNGLRHGEFNLRLNKEEADSIGGVISLKWNLDSSVLAVILKDRVQLWTMGNYHYYLKQEITIEESQSTLLNVNWHRERPLDLAIYNGQNIRNVAYISDISKGSTNTSCDHGIVAVVDGKTLKVTPFRIANVPPPMAFDEIELQASAIDVAVSKDGSRIAILHNDSVSTWSCDYTAHPHKVAQAEGNFPISHKSSEARMIPRRIVFDELNRPVVLTSLENEAGSIVEWATGPERCLNRLADNTRTLFSCTNHQRILCETEAGSICEIKESTSTSVGQLTFACDTVEIWQHAEDDVLFGLSSNGTLHVTTSLQSLRIPGCTSFTISDNFLLYTTSHHLLKFVHLGLGELEIPMDEPEKDERCRNIERGAKIVTVVPSNSSVILQMPRGNFETIYPRALVLSSIREAVRHRDYKKAFLICRKQRVDMNILHDLAPGQFMQDVERVIQQVKKVEFIDLFLSSLSEEDVSKTVYKDTTKGPQENTIEHIDKSGAFDNNGSSKVNKICEAFLIVLRESGAGYLQNIVTAHVCKSPPDHEAALVLVSELRGKNQQEQLEHAVEHVCFLADANRLYDTALGLYDLDVALLVAQQSQKDPREYLPYLQALHEKEPLKRQFSIDNDLKRYSKALKHLQEPNDFEEFKFYMAKHELYNIAIELYRYDDARLRELMRMYADFLSAHNRHKEAGILYEYITDFNSAYEAYRAANMWQECLYCATLANMSDERHTELARDLSDSLEEAKDFVAAGTIHLDYLHDLNGGVRLLCRGYRFAESFRAIAMRNQPELLRIVVDPALIEASAAMTETLAEMKAQLNAQVFRLRELRQKKVDDPMAFLDGGDADGADIPDNISLAPTDASTSGATFVTRYTNRSTGTLATNATRQTSKNRRREERKRARGKKGTVYEEEYLVNSVARLIERVNQIGDDIQGLIEALMRRAMRERAIAVDAAFHGVIHTCRNYMSEVFLSTQVQGQGQDDQVSTRPTGGQGVLWDVLSGTQQKQEAPVLMGFERLSILGSSN